jgi:branched-chain amino acid transport system substrate-binding protein
VQRDDQGTPDVGRKVSEDLVLKEKVDFTIGFGNTGVALKSLDAFQEHKHLLMIPVSTGSVLTAKYPAAQSYIFRAATQAGLRHALRARREIAARAGARGQGRRAEAIIGYTVGPELAVLTQARNEAKFTGLFYGPWPLSFRIVNDKVNGGAEGAMMVRSIIQDLSNERRSSFIARLKRHAGKQPVGALMAAAQTYDAVHLMLRAVFQTKGDTSGDALKSALENLERPYAGVVTTHDKPFSAADHDAFSMSMIWLGVWRHGEIHFQYAEDARRSSYIRRKEQG